MTEPSRTKLGLGLVAVLAAGLVAVGPAGVLSFASGVDSDIDDDSCSITGDTSFECSAAMLTDSQEFVKSNHVFGEKHELAMNRYPARVSQLLVDQGYLEEPELPGVPDLYGENWVGTCEVVAGFEGDYGINEFRVEGELDPSNPLGCKTPALSSDEVEITRCDRSSDALSCRQALDHRYGEADGEYASVEYNIMSDSDGDGVFDRDDRCSETAGELSNGCPNTPPSVSLDAPKVVEDEEEFEVSVSASDPDGQDLSYEWSNGGSGETATYSFARSGQNVSVSVSVSDGIDTVSESATVEVLDLISDGDSSGSETGLLAAIVEWLSLLPGVTLG